MKPTRKDVVRILQQRALSRIDEELKTLCASPPTLYDPTESCARRAIAKFRRRAKNKAVMAQLDAAGVAYSLRCYGDWVSETVYRVDAVVIACTTPAVDKTACDIRPTAAQIALRGRTSAACKIYNQQREALLRRRERLQRDAGEALIDALLGKLLATSMSLTPLINELEGKLDAVIAEALQPKDAK